MSRKDTSWRLVLGVLVLAVLGAVAIFGWDTQAMGQVRALMDKDQITAMVDRAGLWGPALVIGLMTLAVVMSPIPSAPIAMAAGAAYGDLAGTIYVLAGAEIGALIAFGLARILGRNVLERWFGERLDAGLLGSQNALMVTVFLSRLMPFLSFDIISYAAGLSCLRFWRFAVATLAGIIPASFVLAHLGGTMVEENTGAAVWAALGLGLVTGLPILWMALRGRKGSDGR